MIRILLTIVLAYFVVRYLLKIFSPSSRRENVAGTAPVKRKRVDEDRIQDASFKDLPDK